MISSVSQKKQQMTMVNTIKTKVVYSMRFTFFIIIRFIYYFLYEYGILSRPPPPITISSLSEDYMKVQKKRFLDSYNNTNTELANSNIEKCFYDLKLHSQTVEDVNNELEKTWKRRIMMETTPRGNIIMHYDAYKRGFVYYSDNSNIPYFVINAAIMKYVLLYKCRDFFIDDENVPENMISPLLSILNKPEKMDNSENTMRTSDRRRSVGFRGLSGDGLSSNDNEPINSPFNPVLKSSAFAKLKSYNTVSGKLASTDKPIENDTTKPEKNYIRNKIIYSGKISNFYFLQKYTLKYKNVAFASELLDGLKSTGNVQRQVFSYKDFKRIKESHGIK